MNDEVTTRTDRQSGNSIDPHASAHEIEEQVDARRAELNRTLGQLEDRFDPNRMIDYVKDNGGEIAGNLGRTFKQNPVPFVLTGIGLAWLMSAQSNANRQPYYPSYRSSRFDGDPHYEDDDAGDDDWFDRADARDRSMGSPYQARSGRYGVSYVSSGHDRNEGDTEEPGMLDKARDAMSDLGDEISDRVDSMGNRLSTAQDAGYERMSRLGNEMSDRQSSLQEAAAERYAAMSDEARASYDSARRAGRDAAMRAKRHAQSASRRAADFLEEQPLVAGAVGAAFGALIGSLLPPSRTEDRYFGERADAVRGEAIDTATRHAGAAREKLEDQAHDVLEKGRQAAEEALDAGRKKGENIIGKADERMTDKASA